MKTQPSLAAFTFYQFGFKYYKKNIIYFDCWSISVYNRGFSGFVIFMLIGSHLVAIGLWENRCIAMA